MQGRQIRKHCQTFGTYERQTRLAWVRIKLYHKISFIAGTLYSPMEYQSCHKLVFSVLTVLTVLTGQMLFRWLAALVNTSLYQSLFAKYMIEKQLTNLGYIAITENLTAHPFFENHFNSVWVSHANYLSSQYTGDISFTRQVMLHRSWCLENRFH